MLSFGRERVLNLKSKQKYKSSLLIFIASLLTLGSTIHSGAARQVDEVSLKAAVVMGILRFTQWPALAEDSPLTLCASSHSQVAQKLLSSDNALHVRQRPLQVQLLDNLNLPDCHIILFSKQDHHPVLKGRASQSLTICDQCSEPDLAAIKLLRRRNKIGFDINLVQSSQNGVEFSSALLELANKVEGTAHAD